MNPREHIQGPWTNDLDWLFPQRCQCRSNPTFAARSRRSAPEKGYNVKNAHALESKSEQEARHRPLREVIRRAFLRKILERRFRLAKRDVEHYDNVIAAAAGYLDEALRRREQTRMDLVLLDMQRPPLNRTTGCLTLSKGSR